MSNKTVGVWEQLKAGRERMSTNQHEEKEKKEKKKPLILIHPENNTKRSIVKPNFFSFYFPPFFNLQFSCEKKKNNH